MRTNTWVQQDWSIEDQYIKLIQFLYTSNEWSENETKKIISFTIVSKWIQYLGINLTVWVQNLYSKNNYWKFKDLNQ